MKHVTVFLGYFLLFLLLPMVAKYILPWFGGAAGVWTTSMFFMQLCLLAGYAYSRILMKIMPVRVQVVFHFVLLGLSLLLLPILPGESLRPVDPNNSTFKIISLLIRCIGGPFFLLSATYPLFKSWFKEGRTAPLRGFFSISILGSIAGMGIYPVLIEPLLGYAAQAKFWSIGMGLFVVATGICAFLLFRKERDQVQEEFQEGRGGTGGGGMVVLLSVTNALSQMIPPMPFL